MYRSKRGRLGAGALALIAVFAVAGCGGSSSSSSSASPTKPVANGPADAVGAALLRETIAGEAYSTEIYAPQPTLSLERTAIGNLRNAEYDTNLAVRRAKTSAAAQRALVAYLSSSNRLIADLDRMYKQPSMNAIHSLLDSALTPDYKKFDPTVHALRASLGLPPHDPWYAAKPLGKTVYTDSMNGPHKRISWLLGPNVKWAAGGLEISAAAGHNGISGPNTPYSFDSRHVSIEVDAKAVTGNPYFGIACPPQAGDLTTHMVGQIGPGAKWSIGVLHMNGTSYLLHALTPDPVVKTGQTNHLRVDCDQYAPGLTTLRLYLDGKLMGADSAAMSLDPGREPGVAVVSSGPAATVKYSNWRVSQLGG